jgi:hypothetical protein
MYAVAGQKIAISTDPVDLSDDDLVASDFDSVTWINIVNWSTMGASGDTSALITTPLIDRGRDLKQKGTKNAGQMQNVFGLARSDPGQQKLIEAEGSPQNYAFRITGNDAPSVGSAPTPSYRYFHGLVMTAQESGGAANAAQMLNSTIEINSNIVPVQPSGGAAPVNTVAPAISGVLTHGDTLTAYEGVWTGGVDSYTYQWKQDGADISGATGRTYVLAVGDETHNISVAVTAHNTAGNTTATSALTDAIA